MLGAIFAFGLLLSAVAQTAAGVIKVGKVQGEVLRVFADGRASQQLKSGDVLTETDSVSTGQNSLVVLVFMNGSSVKIGADSRLKIEEFKMDPLGEDIAVAGLEKEPSKSKTTLDLQFGEMVGDVKKLNYEGGSSFKIKTPVGAAGIRGTTFRIVFRPTGDGRTFTFQLATSEGKVLFEGSAQAPANVEVPDQQEIVVVAEVNVDTTTGSVTVVSVTAPASTQPISTENKAVIEVVAAQVITEAQNTTTITTTEQTQATQTQQSNPGSGTNESGTNSDSTSQSNTEQTTQQTTQQTQQTQTQQTQTQTQQQQSNAPAVTTKPPQLTGGAGG